jgi:bifunctional ADP-heptose synthase (sugar kinase/adenylyltransferase)
VNIAEIRAQLDTLVIGLSDILQDTTNPTRTRIRVSEIRKQLLRIRKELEQHGGVHEQQSVNQA